ncbi:MAG: TlpA family protein disulfide reductase [Planctomycetes bacterium]|nr:TlpA family protein disulfide reductase [Planctomycetota bacterium]
MSYRFVWVVGIVGLGGASAMGQNRGASIVGNQAPAWTVKTWFNLPNGETNLELDDLAGKVVYLNCFQSWCPGCHSSGLPTVKKVADRYAGSDDVAVLAVQTVFEGFSTNTAEAARRTGEEFELAIPVGHEGTPSNRSSIMRGYRTRGTPWTIIIDRKGMVRYSDFHIRPQQAFALIDRLRAESAPGRSASKVPVPRAGGDRIGRRFPAWTSFRWPAASKNGGPDRLDNPVTLVRWWTDDCAHCEKSLPAVQALADEFGAAGLHTLAIYHRKAPGTMDDDQVIAAARARGYRGAVAIDDEWRQLNRFWMSTGQRGATSVSFLVDPAGVVRYVHPGPEFHDTDEDGHDQCSEDFEQLRQAIRAVLVDGAAPA